MAQPDARWVGEVLLSGPGSRREGLAEQLGGMLDVPVSIAEPLGRLQAGRIPAGEDPYRHTVAAGLALGAA
jgi:Tfp pilus assembly PilM family ATPase